MKYVMLLFVVLFLSCNHNDINIERSTRLKPLNSSTEFIDIYQDEPHFIFLEIIEDVDIYKLNKLLNESISKFESGKKLNIPDYNLIVNGKYQKVIMIRDFKDLKSAEAFHHTLPDLSNFVLYSYTVSFSNYRLILSTTNGLLEYRDFLFTHNK